MKKVTAAVIGYGDRGSVYSNYAFTNPDELEIVAVVDINPYRLSLAKEKFHLKDEQLYTDFEVFLKQGKVADAAFVTTMDALHYYQAISLLKLGYNILLEKPIVNDAKKLLEIQRLADEKHLILSVGHVLRYTPFYQTIKQKVLDGEIGDIIHIDTSEFVGVAHSSSAFARGKWRNKEECHSTMLLQKCCHDLDLICWFNNSTKPVKVASFGARTNVIPENAPKDAADKCYDCPHLNDCIYSAKSLYVLNDLFPTYSFLGLHEEDHSLLSEEEKVNALKTDDPFGKCIYKTNANIVDHQSLILMFENGSIAVHNMVSFVPKPGRAIHIIGTKGEIQGFFESNKFEIRKQDFNSAFYKKEEIDITKLVDSKINHGGGDLGLIKDFVRLLRGEKPSISTTNIDDSIISHLCVYAADESMDKNEIVNIKK